MTKGETKTFTAKDDDGKQISVTCSIEENGKASGTSINNSGVLTVASD